MHDKILKVYENDDTLVLVLINNEGNILGYDFVPHSSTSFNDTIEHLFCCDKELASELIMQGLNITEDKFIELLHQHAIRVKVYQADFLITEALKKYLEK